MNITDILYAKKLAGGGGGSHETRIITSTLADPFNGNYQEAFNVYDGLRDGTIAAYIHIDLTALGGGTFDLGLYRTGYAYANQGHFYATKAEPDEPFILQVDFYVENGRFYLTSGGMYQDGQYIYVSSYASSIPTTIYITEWEY